MDSIVGVMKKVAENEARRIYTTELGTVTAVFPHADESDQDNYQCSVKIKNRKQADGSDFELRKVPVATPYLGLAAIPNVGDLVLVNFIGGDINAPVITGRLYNDEDRPPANKASEFLLQHTLTDGGSLKLDENGKVIVTSKNEKNILTVEDGKVTTQTDQASITLEGGNITIKNDQCSVKVESAQITIATSTATIKLGSSGITIEATGTISIGGSSATSITVAGTAPAMSPILLNDILMFSAHTHVGNLGAPCPVLVGMEPVVATTPPHITKIG